MKMKILMKMKRMKTMLGMPTGWMRTKAGKTRLIRTALKATAKQAPTPQQQVRQRAFASRGAH